jgi:5-deoxy-glucuronate isomerase
MIGKEGKSKMGNKNFCPAGTTRDGIWDLKIEPKDAGWTYSGLRVLHVLPHSEHSFATGESEFILVPLEGSFEVIVDGEEYDLIGRSSVFSGATDTLYVPRDSYLTVSSVDGGRLALPNSLARQRKKLQYMAAAEVPTGIRGSGSMSRLIFNFGGVEAVDADRLIACEVITPGGNWSSYPAHKHDLESEDESELEEIYYYEVKDGPSGAGNAFQRIAPTSPGGADLLEEVRSGDAVLIPNGWHGPTMAAPGFDLYYLNVMAGPGVERRWLITDDPTTSWLRGTWPSLPLDKRLTKLGHADR